MENNKVKEEYQPLLSNLISYCFKEATFSYIERGLLRYSCNLHIHNVINRKLEVKPFVAKNIESEFCMQYVKR